MVDNPGPIHEDPRFPDQNRNLLELLENDPDVLGGAVERQNDEGFNNFNEFEYG